MDAFVVKTPRGGPTVKPKPAKKVLRQATIQSLKVAPLAASVFKRTQANKASFLEQKVVNLADVERQKRILEDSDSSLDQLVGALQVLGQMPLNETFLVRWSRNIMAR